MLDNKGQTLIIFVILIPIFVFAILFCVEVCLISQEKIKLKNVTKIVIEELYENDYSKREIQELYFKNNIIVKDIEIINNKKNIKVTVSYNKKIIGIKNYKIKLSLNGIKKEDRIQYISE